MKLSKKTPFLDLRPALQAFVPLLAQQKRQLSEESNTNKAYHLGRKEFEYVKTLAGDVPAERNE